VLGSKIQAENGIQQGNLNEITTTIINNNIDNFGALQAVPGMAEKLRTAGPYIQHITSLMDMVGRQKSGERIRGNAELYFDLTRRIVNREITDDTQLLPHLPTRPDARALDMQQFKDLQAQIRHAVRPDTRDHEKRLHFVSIMADRTMRSIAGAVGIYEMPGLPQNKEMIDNALARWSMDVRTQLEGATPEQVKSLFDTKSPDFVASADKLTPYFTASRDNISPLNRVADQPKATESIQALPLVKRGKQDPVYLKLDPAKQTPNGWAGGWYRTPDGKPHQKRPAVVELGAGGG
jgi:hypothetical protein